MNYPTGLSEKEEDAIHLLGARTNNLKGLNASFPLGEITVVTGVSGSGKSSLVFETLYGEAYRRYVESLSSFARQYLKALPKPQIDEVKNLPPAIAVKQQRSSANHRSTVGTATELTDLMRVLFTHLAEVYCDSCHKPVVKDSPETVALSLMKSLSDCKVLVVAPLSRWGKIASKDLKSQLEAQGFTRIFVPASGDSPYRVVKLAEAKAADLKGAGVLVDRTSVNAGSPNRLREALQLAFKVGRGLLWIVDEASPGDFLIFSEELECPTCQITYAEPAMALFSHNHPQGACPACHGFGLASEIDWDRVIPDPKASLAQKGVSAWNFGGFAQYYDWAKFSAQRRRMDFSKPFVDYTESDWQWLKEGESKDFDGILGFFSFLDSKKYKAHYRIHASRFRRYAVCGACHGDRLSPMALAPRLHGLNIAEIHRRGIRDLSLWLEEVAATGRPENSATARGTAMMGVAEALEEARARLRYLERIGVGYLTLSRPSRTLSGGELQRINMARCLGSALTETLFCLDEPSAGLHARDSAHLMEVIRELKSQGNTVVMVEHESRLIQAADHMIEIGPGAGHAGGEVVYAGRPRASSSVGIPLHAPTHDRLQDHDRGKKGIKGIPFVELKGAQTHNLQKVTARFPVGAMTAVCGVSGSGKTSLIQHTLYPLWARLLGQSVDGTSVFEDAVAESLGPPELIAAHSEILLVSQAGIGRSQRSNIATYLGLMDEIRKLLASQAEAKRAGLTPGSFSFNTPGGRCETCRGLGTVVEDLSFLGEMDVTCPACEGRRFQDAVLDVKWHGKNLLEILALTVEEARSFFYERKAFQEVCDVVMGIGLGYVTLGQSTSSFSGGEAQRLKLLGLLNEVEGRSPKCLILDEPTTGLSDQDVAVLLRQLAQITRLGHTVIVVEHHLDVLKASDWLIEVGPEASDRGGRIIYQGPPSEIGSAFESVTAPFLQARATVSP